MKLLLSSGRWSHGLKFSGCDWIFTSNGTVPIVPDTLAATVSKIAEEMVKGHESRFSFIPSDIRRTIETVFASKGISRDIRAQIQSNGLSGVQVRHYDRHDYRDEKRRVLEFLAALLHGRQDARWSRYTIRPLNRGWSFPEHISSPILENLLSQGKHFYCCESESFFVHPEQDVSAMDLRNIHLPPLHVQYGEISQCSSLIGGADAVALKSSLRL